VTTPDPEAIAFPDAAAFEDWLAGNVDHQPRRVVEAS
jgi:hypothetical protein